MSSGFSTAEPATKFTDGELVTAVGSTCVCHRVRRHGKWHFVKRLRPELAGDPRYVEAMRKEFETGYGLDHPALARYVELGDDYIMMEYVDGTPLDEFAAHRPDVFANAATAWRLVSQLLEAVRYLHHHQVLHLDLKPANILVTRIGHDVRLIDFGFCYTDTWRDTTGLTAAWAAPEQLCGGVVDERTDIYALGRILESLPLPRRYRRAAQRCLESDPARRYQNIDQLLTALAPRRRWPIAAAVAVVALAITGWLVRDHPVSQPQPATDDTVHPPPADTLAAPIEALDTAPVTAPIPPPPSETAPEAASPADAPPTAIEDPEPAPATEPAPAAETSHNTAPPRHIQSLEQDVQDNINELYRQATSFQRTPRIIFLRQTLPQQFDELINYYVQAGNYVKVSEYTYKRQVVMQVFDEMGM